jgi:hypothetical protein
VIAKSVVMKEVVVTEIVVLPVAKEEEDADKLKLLITAIRNSR